MKTIKITTYLSSEVVEINIKSIWYYYYDPINAYTVLRTGVQTSDYEFIVNEKPKEIKRRIKEAKILD